MENHRVFRIVPRIILVLFAVSILCVATWNWGIGVSLDSVNYFEAASNYMDHGRLAVKHPTGRYTSRPLQPPLYPLLIGGGLYLGLSAEQTALFVSIAGFCSFIFWVYRILERFTGMPWFTSFCTGLFLLNPVFIHIFSMAWTETVFLAVYPAWIFFSTKYITEDNRRFFYYSLVPLGFMAVCRYTVLPFLAISLLLPLLKERDKSLSRLVKPYLGLLLGIFPLAIHFFNNQLRVGHATGESFTFAMFNVHKVSTGLKNFLDFFNMNSRVILPALLATSLLMFALYRALGTIRTFKTSSPIERVSCLLLLSWLGYVGFFLLAACLRPDFAFTSRLLAPGVIPFMLFVLIQFFQIQPALNTWGHLIGYLVLGTWFMAIVTSSGTLVRAKFKKGTGYSGKQWHQSQLIETIEQIPSDNTIYSNAPELIYYKTGRKVFQFPKKWNGQRVNRLEKYPEKFKRMIDRLSPVGHLVITKDSWWWAYHPSPDEIQNHLTLQRTHNFREGLIFKTKKH